MAANSRIEWTDNSVPLVAGCAYKGAGCTNCYAVRDAWRLMHNPTPAVSARYAGTVEKRDSGALVWTGRVNIDLRALDALQAARRPQSWFISQVGDLFHEDVPATVVDAVLAVAALKPEQRLIILSKRPDRMAGLLAGPKPLPNMWVGASIANDRDAADAVVPLASLAMVGWRTMVSYEPAVGPVDWEGLGYEFLDWVISGGESGPKARPTHPDWHRAARDFCTRNGIAFFFKQWGAWRPVCDGADEWYDRLYRPNRVARFGEDQDALNESYGRTCTVENVILHADGHAFDVGDLRAFAGGARGMHVFKVGKKAAGRTMDGRTWDELPWTVAASLPGGDSHE